MNCFRLLGPAVLLSACLAPIPAASGTISDVWVKDNEVWIQTAAGPRQVTHDGLPKGQALSLSRDGNRILYTVINTAVDPAKGGSPPEYIVETDTNGEQLRRFAPDDYVPGSFDRLDWIDERRIGAMVCGRANCFYWILDSESGKTLQTMKGGHDFLWSHDHQYVARRRMGEITVDDHTSYDDLSMLVFNKDDAVAYPPTDPKTGHYYDCVLGWLKWSPDDRWVSFVETEYPSYDSYVVLVSPHGAVLRESLPVDVQYDIQVEWTDNTHLQVAASSQTFHFVVNGDALQEIQDDRGQNTSQVPN